MGLQPDLRKANVVSQVQFGWRRGLWLALFALALSGCVPGVPLFPTGDTSPLPTSAIPPTATIASTATVTLTATPIAGTLPVRLVIPDLKLDTPVTEMSWGEVKAADGSTQ